jgi:pimeloyl-ACP methyl ester carboxylesterase
LVVRRHLALAIDLLGHGESDRPIEADFGVAAQAEYVDRALTVLRVARAVLVGVDIGGGVAMRLAATRPDRVAGLVLVNPVAFEHMPGRDIRTLQRGTARFAFRLSRGMFGATPLLAPVLQGSVANPAHMPDRLVARYLAPFVGRDGVAHLLDLARSLRREEVEEIDLSCIGVPTLIAWGEADPWLPRDVTTRLLQAIPGSTLARLPDVGRLVPEEAPEALARLIVEHAAVVERLQDAVSPGASAALPATPGVPGMRGAATIAEPAGAAAAAPEAGAGATTASSSPA